MCAQRSGRKGDGTLWEMTAISVVEGSAFAEVLKEESGLSFWGGVDAQTGCVIDQRSRLCGQSLTGKILCMSQSKGSCSSTGILLEMIRAGTAPSGFILCKAEGILAMGAVIGQELYGVDVPVYTVERENYDRIQDHQIMEMKQGKIYVFEKGEEL